MTPVLASGALPEKAFFTVDVVLRCKSPAPQRANVLVFRYLGKVYAYVNHCMHMQRPLNCLQDAIFDSEQRWLRCSMHGFIFEPETGICISPVCEGQALQSIKIGEEAGMIAFQEKHLQVLAVRRPVAVDSGLTS